MLNESLINGNSKLCLCFQLILTRVLCTANRPTEKQSNSRFILVEKMSNDINSDKLNKKSELAVFEPGAARFGNFINYYSFNSVCKRLNVISPDLLSQLNLCNHPVVCLDVGCNSGDLTVGLYSHLISNLEQKSKFYILGIDLDDVLITRANESNVYPNEVTFQRLNIMDESTPSELLSYLHSYGRNEFDIISCFSTTMWIHLNYGDDGLEKFLKRVSDIAKYLLLEPQEWKCYKSAVRRMVRLNHEVFAIKNLKIRNIFEFLKTFLENQCDMELHTCFGETSWGRKLYLFSKKDIS